MIRSLPKTENYPNLPSTDLKNWANPGLFLFIFVFLHDTNQIYIDKSIDGVLGTRTQGGRMEGVDESTEQWRPP